MFILKPGQHVHINKGRVHAFRKLTPESLSAEDCHYKLREELLRTVEFSPDGELCISVAWDWMFRGTSSEGVCRELVSVLECAALNRVHRNQTLAIPELAMLQMARSLTSPTLLEPRKSSFLKLVPSNQNDVSRDTIKNVLRGILPSLRYVVEKQTIAYEQAKSNKNAKVNISNRPDSWQNPSLFSMDPYGGTDFFCKFCYRELSNVYMHCDGCEELLSADFNICVDCHKAGAYRCLVIMNPISSLATTKVNHVGHLVRDRGRGCSCHMGICRRCKLCVKCSCRCHQSFTVHQRLLTVDDMKGLVRKVEAVVGDQPVDHADEVEQRLDFCGK